MSIHEKERIQAEFSRLGLHPTYLEHVPVVTSGDAARTRGFSLKQGIKAIVFTDEKGTWIVVNVPADKRADQKKAALACGLSRKDLRMATPEEVLEVTGCEVGSVPPFGHTSPLKILVDKGVYDNVESAFNIGLRTNSVKIPTEEMKIAFAAAGAIEGDFARI